MEKGQKSWFRIIIIHIYSGRYLSAKKGGETSKSKILRILKRGIKGCMANMHKKQRRQDRDGFVMMAK